jgi:hypothetical protein
MELFRGCILGAAVALYACNAPTPERQPQPVTPPGVAAGDTVVRQPMPETMPPSAPAMTAPPVTPPETTTQAIAVPAGALYVCVKGAGAELQQTAIEFAPRVAALCAQNPEMGPCQYEREVCRRGGGRVFAADGKEITKATEAEYDRRVLRARIRAD